MKARGGWWVDLWLAKIARASVVLCPGVVAAYDIWRFRRQAGGSGISNKSLTRQRRRARPAAIAGVLER